MKESDNKDKYLDRTKKRQTLCNMKVTVILVVIDTLGTVTKGLLQGLEDWKKENEWRPSKLPYC